MLSIEVTPIGTVRSPRADRTDVKPYMREFGPIGEVQQPHWVAEVMQRHYDA